MLSTSSSSLLPAGLLYLLLFSLPAADVNARATPNPSPEPSAGQTINVLRRSRQWDSTDAIGEWAQNNRKSTAAKYGHSINGQPAKRANGLNALTNLQFDSTYFGSIAVGTPPTSFNVILDTGSSDLWLATSTTGQSTSKGIALYEPETSSTFVDLGKDFAIQYGSGAAQGVLGQDRVQFAGFEVNQTFGLVNQTSSQLLSQPLSGLMGLGFQSIAASGATPFWEALTSTSGTLDDPLFAFQLTRFTNDTNAQQLEAGGTFTLGAVNNTLFTGDIDYQDVPDGSPGYWIQELASMTVNGQTISLPTGSGAWSAIDTGTTGVGLPASVQAAIFAAVPGSQKGSGQFEGYYTYPCATDVNVTVSWGSSNRQWTISSADFLLQQVSQDNCIGAFFAIDSSGSSAPPFIFGDTFLKNVYSVYRSSPRSVGFASLSAAAISQSGSDLPVPSATIGAVASVTPTGTGGSSPGLNNAAGRSTANSSLAMLLGALLVGVSAVLL